ncbi:S1 domain-containing post-transcriptional regulator GSP13 [Calidifontibacillus oryziterrae]|uniref:S1 domain-containing post-transcriptional regulator GSP13 n=1 Tax=Calidifontibacillus oryziterrae TaxID=1191699 RepID=UPI0002F3414C|nr:S1 domain-containing post-transcriptional regulator GSP13 [Calidifontibacillus oryziterrae]
MSEKYEVGRELSGKVTGIQPYGAFVALDENTQGLVHISEITHGYVKDVSEHLSVGDEVKVKVLSVDEEAGKISLSIKATIEAPEKTEDFTRPKKERRTRRQVIKQQQQLDTANASGFNTLKDKLEDWIKQSSDREKLLKK